jgi:hypothetical protein
VALKQTNKIDFRKVLERLVDDFTMGVAQLLVDTSESIE